MSCITLNPDSVKQFCNNSKQVMVYGWRSCKYKEVRNELCLNSSKYPLSKVYDYVIGSQDVKDKTIEGRTFDKFQYCRSFTPTVEMARVCKVAVLNLVFENYKRKKDGLPIIPLIFCYDIDGKKRQVTPETIFSRTDAANEKIITNSELRLIYKLCHVIRKDPILAQISAVARETIRFVKLAETQQGFEMREIFPEWDDKLWTVAWNQRQRSKNYDNRFPGIGWRASLTDAIQNLQTKLRLS